MNFSSSIRKLVVAVFRTAPARSEDLDRCMSALQTYTPTCPIEELDWIRAHRNVSTGALIAVLKKAVRRPVANDDSALPIFALYLLAEMRVDAAFPTILRLCRLSEEKQDRLLGDVMTQDMSRILASVCGTDIQPLKNLIENPKIAKWSRAAAVEALPLLAYDGRMSRSEVIDYYRYLLGQGLERRHSTAWDAVVCATCDLHPGDCLDLIKRAYIEGFVDTRMVTFNEVQRESHKRVESVFQHNKRDSRGLIRDVWQDMSWMDGFSDPIDDDLSGDDAWRGPMAPGAHTDTKIGRNDSCPCGSGRKYKKCCGG